MDYSITLWGVEVGFWPALLFPFLYLGVFLYGTVGTWHSKGVLKAWSGKGESLFHPRIFLPPFCFFVMFVLAFAAFADPARTYAVVVYKYATNRLYMSFDNSCSMYNCGRGRSVIHCTDDGLKHDYPRIFDACRVAFNIIDTTEAYSKMKADGSEDTIALLRFGLFSYADNRGTTDYARLRKQVQEMNWHDPRLGIFTEIHLSLWDMIQLALKRNFDGDEGFVSLNEADRAMLASSLYPTGLNAKYSVPIKLRDKFEAMKKELRDTAFTFVTDAENNKEKNEFNAVLDKAPVSLVKMMQLAGFLEIPVHVISISADHEIVRELVEKTGYGPLKGQDRGAFHRIKGEENFADVDAIVKNILSTRFRVVSSKERLERESYTPDLGLAAALWAMLGCILLLSPFGRVITKGGNT